MCATAGSDLTFVHARKFPLTLSSFTVRRRSWQAPPLNLPFALVNLCWLASRRVAPAGGFSAPIGKAAQRRKTQNMRTFARRYAHTKAMRKWKGVEIRLHDALQHTQETVALLAALETQLLPLCAPRPRMQDVANCETVKGIVHALQQLCLHVRVYQTEAMINQVLSRVSYIHLFI